MHFSLSLSLPLHHTQSRLPFLFLLSLSNLFLVHFVALYPLGANYNCYDGGPCG